MCRGLRPDRSVSTESVMDEGSSLGAEAPVSSEAPGAGRTSREVRA